MQTKSGMCYFTAGTKLPPFIPLPKFLLAMEISINAKLLYGLVLSRTTLSANTDNIKNWSDAAGRVFVVYTVAQMAEHLNRSQTTVKTALNELEAVGLLERTRQGRGLANHIFILIPPVGQVSTTRTSQGQSAAPHRAEICPPDGQLSAPLDGQNPSPNKNNDNTNKYREKNEREAPTHRVGLFENVVLSEEDIQWLKRHYPACAEEYIERLSSHIASTGAVYRNHKATIVKWIIADHPAAKATRIPDYSYDEGDCV